MSRRRPARGFTLFEVLVALALILLLAGSLFAFLFDMLRVRRNVLDEAARQRAASVFVERIEDDLFCALVGDAALGAGVRGDATTLTLLTRSVPVALATTGNRDEMMRDLQRTSYRFVEGRRVVEARREHVVDGGSASGTWEPFGGDVAKIRFRFHDGDGWRDSFDSLTADAMPAAIEVAIWFDPWPGEGDQDAPSDDVDPGDEIEASSAFDEEAFLAGADDLFVEPEPDRVRVIVIPDAAAPEATPDA